MTEYRIVEVPGGYYKIQYLNKLSIREYMDFDNAYSTIGRAQAEIERLMAYDAARYLGEPVKVVNTYASKGKDTDKIKFTNNLYND